MRGFAAVFCACAVLRITNIVSSAVVYINSSFACKAIEVLCVCVFIAELSNCQIIELILVQTNVAEKRVRKILYIATNTKQLLLMSTYNLNRKI